MRSAFITVLLTLFLGACKTTSSSPSTPQAPTSSPSASSSSAGSAGTKQTEPAREPGSTGSTSASTAAGGSSASKPSAGAGASTETQPDAATDTSASDDSGSAGKPSDEVSLEDTQQQSAADASAESGGDAAVLEAALEAMQRQQAQPSLEDASSSQQGASSATTQGSSDGGSAAAASGARTGAGNAGGAEVEQLNRELNESLARFDGALLSERERNQARGEESGTARAGGENVAVLDNAASGSAEPGYGSAMPARTPGDVSSGSGMSTADGGSGRKGDYQHTASSSSVPADIRDGSDDDVVARQIREAAMKEQDPELREKLWDEYRKYTNSMRRKS